MPSLKPLWLPLLLGGLLLAMAACGGGDSTPTAGSGQLTDPHDVPTATPWQQPPGVMIIDPNAIKPISGGTPTPTGAPGEPGVCGETYTVVEGDYPDMIADKCGITRQQLYDANPGLEPTKLHIGDVLIIPNVSPSPVP